MGKVMYTPETGVAAFNSREEAFGVALAKLIEACGLLGEFKPSEVGAMTADCWMPREVSDKDPRGLTDKEIRYQKGRAQDARFYNQSNAEGCKADADAIASLDPKMLKALATLLNQRADLNAEAEAKAIDRNNALTAEEERRKEEAAKVKAVGDPQAAILELQRQIEQLKAKGN